MNRILFCICLAVTIAASAMAQTAASTGDTSSLRVGTYNLRMQWLDKNGPNAWERRHDKCVRSIRDNDFDVLGVQEVTDFAAAELSDDLRDTYAVESSIRKSASNLLIIISSGLAILRSKCQKMTIAGTRPIKEGAPVQSSRTE